MQSLSGSTVTSSLYWQAWVAVKNRRMGKIIQATTVKGQGHFLFRELKGHEAVSTLFEYHVDLVSKSHAENLAELLATPLTVMVAHAAGQRLFSGLITEAQFVGRESQTSEYYIYRFTVRPWLWYLTQTSDSRIFQNQSALAVIRQILQKYPFEVEYRLAQSYRDWVYCVQYDETDFNFISRLMEHEGIYYWFRHEQGKHVLVVGDADSAHEVIAGEGRIPYFAPDRLSRPDTRHIDRWMPRREVHPATYCTVDFDFNKPQAGLDVKRKAAGVAPQTLEIYDPIGGYTEPEDGERYAQIRLESLTADNETVGAQADHPGLAAGYTFTLKNHPDQSQNTSWLVLRTNYHLKEAPGASAGGKPSWEHQIRLRFTAIPTHVQYRAPRVTPIPRAAGPHTALVVGPAGEKIWTDKYGRIKVQFHWDRQGQRNDDSSCWIRVSSPWAGGGFGGVQIPRVNDEVIVNFVGGFLDRPIVVGRVYNASNMPAMNLPADATQSGIKTRSKDGAPDNANSMLFEDRPGAEQLAFGAERDMDTHVKNNENLSVAGAQAGTHGGATTMSVGGIDDNIFRGPSTETNGANHQRNIVGMSNDIVIGPRTHRVGATAVTVMGRGFVQNINAGLANFTYNAGRSRQVQTDFSHTVSGPVRRIVNGTESSTITSGGYFKQVKGGPLSMKAGSVDMKSTSGLSQFNARSKLNLASGGPQSLSNPATLGHTSTQHSEAHDFSFKLKGLKNTTEDIYQSSGIVSASLFGISSSMAATSLRMSAVGLVATPLQGDMNAAKIEISGFKLKKYGSGEENFVMAVLISGLITRN